MTARLAAQLRSLSDVDVALFGPRVLGGGRGFTADLRIPDRVECLRSALVEILSVGLSPNVNDDVPCLDGVNTLGAAFASATSYLRLHTLRNMLHLSSAVARE